MVRAIYASKWSFLNGRVPVSKLVAGVAPLAHVNIGVPLVYGQALAYATTGAFSWKWAFFAHIFGVLDHLAIVYANDLADEEGDRRNPHPTPFSGGSRVIPEGLLSRHDLRRAAGAASGALLVLSFALSTAYGREPLLVLGVAALLLLWLYSFPPARLSYRGHGEWLQGIGMGVVLPAVGFSMQTGTIAALPWFALIPTVLLSVAGHIGTALPDREADLLVSKRTVPVRYGEAGARWIALGLVLFARASLSYAMDAFPRWGSW